MKNVLTISICFFLLIVGLIPNSLAQVPIQNYSVNSLGQVELEINSTTDNYYVLNVKTDPDSSFKYSTSLTMGAENTTIISEVLGAYPIDHYEVIEYSLANPGDLDGDGINDLIELQHAPFLSPANPADSINIHDGVVMVDNLETFEELSVKEDLVEWSEFLNGQVFVKYIIVNFDTDPIIYFINSETHQFHRDFGDTIGISSFGDHIKKGQIIYHSEVLNEHGEEGVFSFNYSNGYPHEFAVVQRTLELLASNMPFVQNNLSYYITDNNKPQYLEDSVLFNNSRVSVLFEEDVYSGVDYLGLNQQEGYGLFRKMELGETPSNKDIVLYEALPNALPRVGGIMTSVIQTPLSHVNLRAIQNNIPNAFIRDPLALDSINQLLDHYIYFKVEKDSYVIREASLTEVNQWYENIRPEEEQIPPLNLNYTEILPLDDIEFDMYDGYGAKCTNVATMRTFNLPENTIPNGFGIPFSYYQEFMKFNNFFQEIETMISDPDFQSDGVIRQEKLKEFRQKIKDADMPSWMLIDLAIMQSSFPSGTSIRCRSSSNNEDLPTFNGAGLYDSKTQHPWEGHISKSIKQVYASLWNLRAYEEREFYRINHYVSSMGVLCHPNYSEEKSNGVGVSADPLYNTTNTFYLNTQVDEQLITNPDSNAIPEEMLLYRGQFTGKGYLVIQHSNLVHPGAVIMSDFHLNQLRDFLNLIHDEFEILYEAPEDSDFAIDIEYKITADDQLIIKQARPWVTYKLQVDPEPPFVPMLDYNVYPNPASDKITIQGLDFIPTEIVISNSLGQQYTPSFERNIHTSSVSIQLHDLPPGIYVITIINDNGESCISDKFIKINP